ncbi:GNAT family N-acetyltransferase [Flavobacterium sp. 3HN19-14]|uniref:GNAT family N-acetyltransferase n=1 Tax=Flavobacterium sp. 3HN19-14 TaxID=3448133 RepID=UPI003EE32170
MFFIKEISASETIPLRHIVLRAGKPVESCRFDGDELPSTFHLGYFEEDNLIGIISVFENKNSEFPEEKQFQIRGMAVSPLHQKLGIGQKLVQYAETAIIKKRGEIIWFNARIAASEFYSKMNYHVSGNEFEIPDVGLHFLMFKKSS